MRNNIPYLLYFTAIIYILAGGCNKAAFLDAKPRTTISIPTTLQDLRQLLDNDVVMNVTPHLGEVSCDDYYLSFNFWQDNVSLPRERNGYLWAEDIFEGTGGIPAWNQPYQQILIANVVIDRINSIVKTAENQMEWNDLKGAAHFYRAYAFYNLMDLFAPPFDKVTADADLGIPLKLQGDVNEAISRNSVAACYNQIIADFGLASSLLAKTVPKVHINRPSKPAALGALARVYLNMRQYNKALLFADSCLILHNQLIDYNTLDASSPLPFTIQNAETIYHTRLHNLPSSIIHTNLIDVKVDTNLYQSYQDADIRKAILYNPNLTFKRGGYSGLQWHFTGIATSELYLIRSECRVRTGDIDGGLNDLNTLLENRHVAPYSPIVENDPNLLLNSVLSERRKELVRRGIRWSDLRRLNKDGRNITLIRKLGNNIYTLTPNSSRYVLPIPPDEIAISKIPQNNRSDVTGLQ